MIDGNPDAVVVDVKDVEDVEHGTQRDGTKDVSADSGTLSSAAHRRRPTSSSSSSSAKTPKLGSNSMEVTSRENDENETSPQTRFIHKEPASGKNLLLQLVLKISKGGDKIHENKDHTC